MADNERSAKTLQLVEDLSALVNALRDDVRDNVTSLAAVQRDIGTLTHLADQVDSLDRLIRGGDHINRPITERLVTLETTIAKLPTESKGQWLLWAALISGVLGLVGTALSVVLK